MPTSSIISARTGSLTRSQKISVADLEAITGHFDGYLWSMDSDGRYILFNQALSDTIKELTGQVVRPGDKIQDFLSLLDPSMRLVWEGIRSLASRGEPVKMIQEFRIKGQPAYFEISAIPIVSGHEVRGLSCFVKDLTIDMLNKQKLRVSESRFRSLIENGSDIICLVDGEGRIVYGSPSIEYYFGIPDAEQLGKNAFEYVHPDDIGRVAECFLEVLESPGKPIFIEAKAVSKDKQAIWVEGTVTNLLGTEGIHGIVCNFRDVTARKHAEQLLTEEKILRQKQILKATIEAQDNEREEIGRELHDNVNQILTTARLYLDCIADGGVDSQDMIRRSSGIITTAIEEIRKLSRSMTQSFHPEVGLRLSIEDLVESIRRLSEGIQIRLHFFLPGELSLDERVKRTLFRIIQEQLNNVLKHSQAASVEVSLRQERDQIRLHIADDGKGFDPGKKRDGIGISNIINRAEAFQGQVILDTGPGKGCKLSVIIPVPGLAVMVNPEVVQ